MKLSSWFAHYGLTGTLFIISQVIVLLIFFDTKFIISQLSSFGNEITPVINSFPEAFHSVVQSLAVALSIAVVFLLGLLLDLFGSFLLMWELSRFRTHIKQNQS